jgi:hypothetical protein
MIAGSPIETFRSKLSFESCMSTLTTTSPDALARISCARIYLSCGCKEASRVLSPHFAFLLSDG